MGENEARESVDQDKDVAPFSLQLTFFTVCNFSRNIFTFGTQAVESLLGQLQAAAVLAVLQEPLFVLDKDLADPSCTLQNIN